MLKHLLRALLPLACACSYGLPSAHAAIYTWTDVSGRINISNLAPPEGTHLTSVVPGSPPSAAPPRTDGPDEAARRLEMQALADRVRQLELEAQFAQRSAPPVATYQAPPTLQYSEFSEFPPAYAEAQGPGCDPTWAGCGNWWMPFGFPAAIVVVPAPGFRRARPIHGGPNVPIRRPMHPSAVAYHR